MKYKCISADSHLEIRPDRYAKRVPEKFRDRAPKVIALEDGTLAVLQEGQPLERLISNISCGVPYEERRPFDPLPGLSTFLQSCCRATGSTARDLSVSETLPSGI